MRLGETKEANDMSVRPLRGQVLVRLLPQDFHTNGGLHLPELFAEDNEKAMPRKGVVVSIGSWRKTKDGHSILPDFRPGSRVLFNEYAGKRLTRDFGENYRMCKIDDLLAVLEEEL
jgi:co-chaperonin GroES (HSP10)